MKLTRSCLGCSLALVVFAGACACSSGRQEGLFRWSIATAVEIEAPPARVWQVLTDLRAYPEWNPFIVAAEGKLAVGETLSLQMALPGRDPVNIEPRLLVVEPERELRWKGQLFLPGLFDGEHAFRLTALDGGRTRLEHSERFAGALLPLARLLIYEDTLESFRALDAQLARRAAGGG